MTSASASPSAESWCSRSLMRVFQSGILDSRHASDRLHKCLPAPTLLIQQRSPCARQPVVAPPALRGLLDPSAVDEPAILESIKQRVQRRHPEAKVTAGSRFYELCDLISVAWLILEQGKDEQ